MKQHRHQGLTWLDVLLLMVVLVIALAIFMPLAARIRYAPTGPTCGTNLSGIGKAMLIYANDYGDELPCAGGRGSSWAARTPNWMARDRFEAFALDPNGEGGQASISASLYLLVKYLEVSPRSFLCVDRKGIPEKKMTIFKPEEYQAGDRQLTDLWDFGPDPAKHCSFAYQMVYGPHRLTIDSPPGFAVAADRNPWTDAPYAKARDFSKFLPDVPPFNGTAAQGLGGNTFRHKGEGQNVMYLDTHVEFEKRTFCGLDDDNIYTSWDGQDKARGVPPRLGSAPADARDSLLVNDPISLSQ